MKTKRLRGILPGMPVLFYVLAALHCGGDEKTADFTLSIQPSTVGTCLATVFAGQSRQFTALATQADGSSQDVTTKAAWRAQDLSGTGVATISASGLAAGVGDCQATITASYMGTSASSTLAVLLTGFGSCAPIAVKSNPHVVWAADTCNIWAIPSANYSIQKCDGKTWSIQTQGDAAFNRFEYYALAGLDAGNLWAVGARRVNLLTSPLIVRWDGTAWHNLEPVGVSQLFVDLFAVWPLDPRHVWAVGAGHDQYYTKSQGIIWQWDGSAWTESSTATPHRLNGIWGSDTSHIWAVGASGTILQWDGSAWHD